MVRKNTVSTLFVSVCHEHHHPCGAAGQLLLRPEHVQVQPNAPYHATLITLAFKGAAYLGTLRLDNGQTVYAWLPTGNTPSVGERVTFTVNHATWIPA